MKPGILETLKRSYWKKREQYATWRRQCAPAEIRRHAALRLHAWRHPVVEIEGVRLYRGSGLSIPVLESLKAGRYETPEARIVGHALQAGDTVLELGTGLGFPVRQAHRQRQRALFRGKPRIAARDPEKLPPQRPVAAA